MVTVSIQQQIQARETSASVRNTAIREGMQEDGFRKIADGQTTIEEIARVPTEV